MTDVLQKTAREMTIQQVTENRQVTHATNKLLFPEETDNYEACPVTRRLTERNHPASNLKLVS